MSIQIITPYVFKQEIKSHVNEFLDYDVYYEQDIGGIGSDLMFQKMWNKFPDDDIFILHSDMSLYDKEWFSKLNDYITQLPDAGIIGCLLLYPAKNEKGKHYIQSAGGKFTNNKPDHFGSGLILETKQHFKENLEVDEGQYDNVREVSWTTFGGCYIKREAINDLRGFSPDYEWTYNRDVDFCLRARQKGYKIYQVPIRLLHHESKDNKRIKQANNSKVAMEHRNLETLQKKWQHTEFYKTINRVIK